MNNTIDPKTLKKLKKLGDRLTEDHLREIVLTELANNYWDAIAQDYAVEEAGGDEKKASAYYSKHRVRRIKDILAEIGIVMALEQKAEQDKSLEEERYKVRLEELLGKEKRRNSLSFAIGSWFLFILALLGGWFLFINLPIGMGMIIFALGMGYLRNRQTLLTPNDQKLLKQEKERERVEDRNKGFKPLIFVCIVLLLVLILVGLDPKFS